MVTYYFKIDSAYGKKFVGITYETENVKWLWRQIEAEADLKKLLEHGHEKVICSLWRKPKGVEFTPFFRGQSWASSAECVR